MMLSVNFTLFLTITFIVSASPGPVMLSSMSNGARFGMRKAFEGMIGASLGNLTLIALSVLGLGLIVSQNPLLFNVIKWIGAAYLVYLGVQIIRTPIVTTQSVAPAVTGKYSFWLNSFLVAISNPKGLIYFGALFPQFISYQQPLGLQFSLLIIVFLIIDLAWMFVYAAAGNRIMYWLKKPKHQTLFNYVSGGVLIAAGLAMALFGKS